MRTKNTSKHSKSTECFVTVVKEKSNVLPFTECSIKICQFPPLPPPYLKLDPVSRVTGIPGWYWILGIKCTDTTDVGLVY